MSLKNAGQSDKMASDEYIQCVRRLQANLSYMMPHGKAGQESKIQPGPAYVSPPRHMPQLGEKYAQLKELFPGWPGMEHRMSQSSASPERKCCGEWESCEWRQQRECINGCGFSFIRYHEVLHTEKGLVLLWKKDIAPRGYYGCSSRFLNSVK